MRDRNVTRSHAEDSVNLVQLYHHGAPGNSPSQKDRGVYVQLAKLLTSHLIGINDFCLSLSARICSLRTNVLSWGFVSADSPNQTRKI